VGTPEIHLPSSSFVKRETVRRENTRQPYVPPFASNVSRLLGVSFQHPVRKEDDGERLLVEPKGMLLPHFQGIATSLPL